MRSLDFEAIQSAGLRSTHDSVHHPPTHRLYTRRIYHCTELCFDLLALSVAWHATLYLRVLLNPFFRAHFQPAALEGLVLPLPPILVLWAFTQVRVYLIRPVSAAAQSSALRMAESALITWCVIALVAFGAQSTGGSVSRSYIILFFLVSYVSIALGRTADGALRRSIENSWPVERRIAVVGLGYEADVVAQKLRAAYGRTANVVGIITPDKQAAGAAGTAPVLGAVEQIGELINVHALQQIVTVRGHLSEPELEKCSQITKRMGVVMTRLISLSESDSRVEVTTLYGMHLVDQRPLHFTATQQRVKFVFDISIASFLLLLLSPVFIICALLIKITSPGPVLFRSRRVGKGGRYFSFLKFRSMYCESNGRALVEKHNQQAGHIFKIRNDPRITPVGSFLRRYSLDELPQLLNVIRGEMSLVGPRPLPACDLEPDGMSKTFTVWTRQRARVLPGLTGLWQIRGRSDLSFESMVALDSEYVRNWSLLLDLKVLLATPIAVLGGRGAY